MNRIRVILIFCTLAAFGFAGIFLSSCKKRSLEGMIIFTQVSGEVQDINLSAAEAAGQKTESRIAAIYSGKNSSQPVILTREFYSARSPEISSDGTMMLFSAKQKTDDTWQIWEMDLEKSKTRKITSVPENCFDPAYLPNGRVIFSRQTVEDNLKSILTMASCNPDGSDITQVTYNPYNYSASTVLKDGRVLVLSGEPENEDSDAVFMVLRPDGTKNQLFYKGPAGSHPATCGRETAFGGIVFIESDKEKADRGDVISIRYNHPLHTRTDLSAGIEGNFIAVFPLKSGKLLVSYRKSESEKYALHEFDPENKSIGPPVYGSNDFNITEVVVGQKTERPKKLPSEVDMGVKTGLILCQDVNVHNMGESFSSEFSEVNRIRIIGADSSLGEFEPAKDGSFYLKVIADTPFRIQAIDDKGNVTGKPCGWIYLRPNERRGCVGCHEDNEMVPDNKVSLAVGQAPVNIPVHIGKVVEKKVSLE